MVKQDIKVVHIVEGFVGGLSTYMSNVLPELAKSGFDVTLICSLERSFPNVAEKIAELRKKHIKVHIVPMRRRINPLSDLYCFIAILRILLRHRFDIVHTHCSKAGALGRLAALLTDIKIRFHSSHCFSFLRCGNVFSKKIYFTIEKLFGKFTTNFIAVSKADAESAKMYNIFPPYKCLIVSNGLSCDKESLAPKEGTAKIISRASLGLAENVFVASIACRLVEYKGIFTFLEAARLSESNCIFLIAGDGKLKPEIEKYIFKNNLSKKVKILGHVSHMQRIYNISDIVISCSRLEAQPYLLLEAMRAKCPIVATEVAGNKELLANQRGLLIQPQAEKIAKAIDKLLFDENKRKELAQNAYDYFCEHHRLENQIMRLSDIYTVSFLRKERKKEVTDCIRA